MWLNYRLQIKVLKFEEQFNKKMPNQQRKFLPQYNQVIITLIKNKFLPLRHHRPSIQGSRNSLLSHLVDKQTKSCHINHHASLPSVPSLSSPPSNEVLAERSTNQLNILEKARKYIEYNRSRKEHYRQKSCLEQYIKMFERPIRVNERGKRGSIQFSLSELDNRQWLEPSTRASFGHEQPQLSQQEQGIMNAKIRRKFNHRKIINLAKKY